MVRKRPSRVRGGLDGVRFGWGGEGADVPPPMPQPMGEKTNLVGVKDEKEKEKEGGKERWWTIGRGRKDSKDKEEKKEEKKKGKENYKMSASLKRMCFFLFLILCRL